MIKQILTLSVLGLVFLFSVSCKNNKKETVSPLQDKVSEFAKVKLNCDLSQLTIKERQMIPFLIEAAKIMDDLFWKQTWGDRSSLLDTIVDPFTKEFIMINYGPWERLNGNMPFIDGIGDKPKGANFYPSDMTKEEFEAFSDKNKTNLYTILVRDENKKLKTVWYHEAFKAELEKASELILKAAQFAEDEGLKKYLNLCP